MVADLHRRTGIDFADHADGFIAGHQRITQTRKRRHGPVPQQAFGASADAAEGDVDFDVIGFKSLDLQRFDAELLRGVENNGLGSVAHGAASNGQKKCFKMHLSQ